MRKTIVIQSLDFKWISSSGGGNLWYILGSRSGERLR